MCRGTKDSGCDWCGEECGEDSECYPEVRTYIVNESAVELIDKGAPMGIGLFIAPSKDGISHALDKDQVIGEYIGEVLPGTTPAAQLSDYAFTWDESQPWMTNIIEPITHGNIFRFCNHHCNPNVEIQSAVISGRQILLLSTTRAIAEGEELCVSYGAGYFTSRNMQCACNSEPQPHEPGVVQTPVAAKAQKKKGRKANS